MKVCFKLIRGGSGSDVWTVNLSRELQTQGVETHVQIFPHGYQFFPHLLKIASCDDSADIIHTNSWNGFAFKKDAPMVVTEHLMVHDSALDSYKNLPQKIFHKAVYGFEQKSFKAADQITCVSEYTKQAVKKTFGYDAACIHNGVDTDKFFPKEIKDDIPGIDKNKTVLLFVGNMTRRKGADMLPAIMDKLGDKFVLLCASGLSKNIKKNVGNIQVIGRLTAEELLSYYNFCDILLFPTRMEGLSLTVLEAMACARPVVTTNASSMPELIIDGSGGFLCGQDDVDGFVKQIRVLSEDVVLRKKMGGFNRKRVEEYFSIKKMAEKYRTLYEQLLKGER